MALGALNEAGDPFGFATCGLVLGPPADRTLFDKLLPKSAAIGCINRQVGFEPVEPGFLQVQDRPQWAIPWVEDDPAMITPSSTSDGSGWREERTGLHEREFIETRRCWFTQPVTHHTRGGLNVLNLVQGEAAVDASARERIPDPSGNPEPMNCFTQG